MSHLQDISTRIRQRLQPRGLVGGRIVAVDLEGRQARVALVTLSERKPSVRQLTSLLAPDDVVLDDPAAVGAWLGEALRQSNLGGHDVLMALPRKDVVLKPLKLPKVESSDELASMVRFQVDKELPFRADEAVLDFTLAPHYDAAAEETAADSAEVEVLVTAAKLEVVTFYRQLAEAGQIKLRGLGLRPYADWRCLQACDGSAAPDCQALVHLSAHEAEITVVSGGSLTFSRATRIDPPSSGGNVGSDAPSDDQRDPGDPVRDDLVRVEELVKEIARSLRSYQGLHRESWIDRVLIAGDTGLERRVAGPLSDRLEVPCRLLCPADHLPGLDASHGASAYLTVLGLAFGASDRAGLPVDFLHPKRPAPPPNLRQRRLLIAAAAVVALVCVIIGRSMYLGGKQADVTALRTHYNTLKEQAKQLRLLTRQAAALKEWQQQDRDWLANWAYLSALLPGADQAYVTSFRANSDGSVSLSIKARRVDVITAIAERLDKAGYTYKAGSVSPMRDRFGYPISTPLRIEIAPHQAIDLAHTVAPQRTDRAVPAPIEQVSVPSVPSTPIATTPAPTAAATPSLHQWPPNGAQQTPPTSRRKPDQVRSRWRRRNPRKHHRREPPREVDQP